MNGLELIIRGDGRVVEIGVIEDGTPVHADRVDLADPASRRRFVEGLGYLRLAPRHLEALRRELERVAANGSGVRSQGGPSHRDASSRNGGAISDSQVASVLSSSAAQWIPFPVSALPEPFESFISRASQARQCDPAAVALPALACMAGVIGNSRTVRLWADWYAPAILWTALVSPSGAVKTPAFRAAREPLDRLERKARKDHGEATEVYEIQEAQYQAQLSDWKKAKATARGEPPEKPEQPTLERFIVEDSTLQALGRVLMENPRGLVLARDELSGWIRGFDQFTGAVGADVARWLEIYRAGSLSVDRVGSNHLYAPRASVSICGTIQDEVVVNVFSGEHQANGLLARFLLARPPEPKRRWRSSRSAGDILDLVSDRFAKLATLDLPLDDGPPRALGLSPEAEAFYGPWFNALNERRRDTEPGSLRQMLAKAEELPGRLGLILALGRANHPEDVQAVDGDSMVRALVLADWFIAEGGRVLEMFAESQEQRAARMLLEWIRDHEPVAPRDVARSLNRYSGRGGTERAERDLEALVSADALIRKTVPPGPKGGRSKVVYQTPDDTDGDTNPKNPEKNEVVSVSVSSEPPENTVSCHCPDTPERLSDGSDVCPGCGRNVDPGEGGAS